MSNDNDISSDNNYKLKPDEESGIGVGVVIFIVFILLIFILHIVSIVDVAINCKENKLVQLLLVLFVPFYAIIYFFIKKSMCPRETQFK